MNLALTMQHGIHGLAVSKQAWPRFPHPHLRREPRYIGIVCSQRERRSVSLAVERIGIRIQITRLHTRQVDFFAAHLQIAAAEIGMGTGQTQVVAGRDQRIVVAMLVSRYQLYDLAGDARRQGQMQLSVVAIGRGEIELQRFDDGPDGVK